MHALLAILAIVAIVVIAVVHLQSIDGMTVRRSRQMSSSNFDYRIRCPRCNEQVIPLTGCPSCENKIEK